MMSILSIKSIPAGPQGSCPTILKSKFVEVGRSSEKLVEVKRSSLLENC